MFGKKQTSGRVRRTLAFMILTVSVLSVYAQKVEMKMPSVSVQSAQGVSKVLQNADSVGKPWKFTGNLGLNLMGDGFINWAAGGRSTLSGSTFTKLNLTYLKQSFLWDTNLDIQYGLKYKFAEDLGKDGEFEKTSDKLRIDTRLGWAFHPQLYLAGLIGFQTQMGVGTGKNADTKQKQIISMFMAPAYTDISVGIDWRPNAIFSVYCSPVAGRITSICVSDRVNHSTSDDAKEILREVLLEDDPHCTEEVINYVISHINEIPEMSVIGMYFEENGGLRQVLKDYYGLFEYGEDGSKVYLKNSRTEIGLSLRASADYSYKDFRVQANLALYTPYKWDKTEMYRDANGKIFANPVNKDKMTFEGYKDNNRRFGNFDVALDCRLTYCFLKVLQLSAIFDMRYENGLKIRQTRTDSEGITNVTKAERVQFHANVGFGVGYMF